MYYSYGFSVTPLFFLVVSGLHIFLFKSHFQEVSNQFFNCFRHCPLCFFNLPITVSGLAKVAIFTTNVDAENRTLINHKCVCGALNRHFCQTRVVRSVIYLSNSSIGLFAFELLINIA